MTTNLPFRPFSLLLVLAVLTRRNGGLRLNARETAALAEVLHGLASALDGSADSHAEIPPVMGVSLAAVLAGVKASQ